METTVSTSATCPEGAAIACPVCGRPARASIFRNWISQVLCRRCDAVWQITPSRHPA
jgi:hypothetical protein